MWGVEIILKYLLVFYLHRYLQITHMKSLDKKLNISVKSCAKGSVKMIKIDSFISINKNKI